jgi:flagellar basal body-associated protein FliL
MGKNIKIVLIIIIIVAIIIGVYYYGFFYKKDKWSKVEEIVEIQKKVTKPVELNPVENLPNTNPFEAETNPFKEGYKNPFE